MVGAKLVVDDLGRFTGTLGGGCVEGDAFAEAKRALETGDTSLREYELTEDLAWVTGLVCGGTTWISIELVSARCSSAESASRVAQTMKSAALTKRGEASNLPTRTQ